MDVVAEDAQPVDPDEDFSAFAAGFTAREPEQVPAYYERGENGVYAVENRQGGKEYRVYGRVNGQPAAWHAADENGNILDAQSAPVEPYDDFVAHVQGFEREEPETTPAHYEKTENGLYAFKNAQGETEYRAYGSKDRGGANWYAVDEEGKLIAEDAQPVNPDEEEAFVTEEPTAEPTEAAVPAMTLTTATAEPTTEAVVNLETDAGRAKFAVYVTGEQKDVRVVLTANGEKIYEKTFSLSPRAALEDSAPVSCPEDTLRLAVYDAKGRLIFFTCRKPHSGFPTKGLQSAARIICAPMAHKFHTCSLKSIFSAVHAAGKNDCIFFAACGRQTLRGFFAV